MTEAVERPAHISQEDWDSVDVPEMTDEQFARARPFAEAFPEAAERLKNKGGRPKGIPNKVTPTVEKIILSMKAERRKVAVIARELRLSRQTVYEVLKRA